MTNPQRIGMIGLDTSHVPNFTKLLNDETCEYHIPGARVVAAYPGGSKDFDLSWSRVEGFTSELRDQYDVKILDSPAAVAEAVDLLFIMSVDGRVHLEQFRETISMKRPTFVDKPFTLNAQDAHEIFRLADKAGVPVMSSSAMRYADVLVDAITESEEPIVGCDVFGPMEEQSTQPGLFWYGIHTVEMIVAVMGTGCREVRCVRTDDADLVTFVYNDGRLASLHGLRNSSTVFGLTIHRKKKGPQFVDISQAGRPSYAGLIEAILGSLPQGTSAVPAEETIEVLRLIEAANESRQADGRTVSC